MGLAVLPARLAKEITELKKAMLAGADELRKCTGLSEHIQWAEEILSKYTDFSEENADDIIKREIGAVFEEVLKDAGVFKRDEKGKAAFMRFVEKVIVYRGEFL